MAIPNSQQPENFPPAEKLPPQESSLERSDRWTKGAYEELIGSREGLNSNTEAQKAWDHYELMPAYRNEKKYLRGLLINIGRDWCNGYAKYLESRAETAMRSHELMRKFMQETHALLRVKGEEIRAKTEMPEFAEPKEVLLLRKFAEALQELNYQDVLDIIEEDKGYIRLLIHLREGSAPPIDGTYPPFSGPSLLDKERAPEVYQDQMMHLARFTRGNIEPAGKRKSESRLRYEETLWSGIVQNMSLNQRIDFFEQYMGIGQEGVIAAQNLFVRCVKNGVLSKQDVVAVATELEKGHGDVRTPDFLKQIDGAVKEFEKNQETMKGVVQYLTLKTLGNPAQDYMTFSNAVAELVARSVGTAMFVVDGVTKYSTALRGKKGAKEIAQGIAEGTAAFFTSETAAAGGALSLFALDKMTKGALRDRWLYARGKEADLELKEQESARRVTDHLGKHPTMADFVYANYDLFYGIALRNRDRGDHFLLRSEDLAMVTDKELETWSLSGNRQKAVEVMNDVFYELAHNLNCSTYQAVGKFFEDQKLAFDESLYLSAQEKVHQLHTRFKKFPGVAEYIAAHYDELKNGGDAFLVLAGRDKKTFESFFQNWKLSSAGEQKDALQEIASAVESLSRNFALQNSDEARIFFDTNKLLT